MTTRPGTLGSRITSYNVCYTKLLRRAGLGLFRCSSGFDGDLGLADDHGQVRRPLQDRVGPAAGDGAEPLEARTLVDADFAHDQVVLVRNNVV